ncbi:MAG: hypothetical protein IT342_22345 [Candidatus Melainabacteria bacterium]|nr:hypothetical protein [Candidatus Melainabacteria bacterium]
MPLTWLRHGWSESQREARRQISDSDLEAVFGIDLVDMEIPKKKQAAKTSAG